MHRRLDRYAERLCPVGEVFGQRYHWSLMQVEYSTDLIFRSEATLKPLYEQLSRQAVLAVKAEQVASFLGKKITPQLAQEIGSRFATRIEGTCIKHRFGKTGVKMYDKFGRVLRLETTTNDVSFFKHHRKVEHQDGHSTRELAPLKKTIYSLIDLREILAGCNRRYLEFLSALEDTSSGERDLARLTASQQDDDRTIKGLNFFAPAEQKFLRALLAAPGVQYPRPAPGRPQRLRRRVQRLASVARAAPPARAGLDQARGALLPLLPHAPGARCHRSCLLPDPVPDRARSGYCTLSNSSPKSSTLK